MMNMSILVMIGMVKKLPSLNEVIGWIILWKKWKILIFGRYHQCEIYLIYLTVHKQFIYYRRTVRDLQTGQDVVLSDKDVELIQRIESSKIPDSTYEEYAVKQFVLYLSILVIVYLYEMYILIHILAMG